MVIAPKDIFEEVLVEEVEYRSKVSKEDVEPRKIESIKEVPKNKIEVKISLGSGPKPPHSIKVPVFIEARELIQAPASPNVLIVDDDPDTSQVVKQFLGDHGYQSVIAQDGAEALLILGHRRFDLILSDIAMPNLDGIRLLEVLVNKQIKTPVIFLTAVQSAETEAKCLELGAEDFIRKPITRDILLARVKHVLTKSKSS